MGRYDNLITGRTAKLPGDYRAGKTLCEVFAKEALPGTHPEGFKLGGRRDYRGTITIVAPGTPLGKPRMTRRDKWARRPCVVSYWAWADYVRWCAGTVPPAEKVESLSWVAMFQPPKSWSKTKRAGVIGTQHRSKPDRDNIDKAVLDALYPGGDAAIARGALEKIWGWEASLTITITLVRP